MMSTWTIASLTFRETLRRRALLGAVLLTLGFLALFGIASYLVFRDLGAAWRPAANPLLGPDLKVLATGEIMLSGLYGVANIAGLLAIFVAAGTIATEVEEGTLHAIVPRPLHRWEIVLGKWLGFARLVVVYVVVTGLAASLIIFFLTGYLSAQLVPGLALIALEALLLLTISLLLSTFLPTLTTGIVAFILYVVANVGGMVEQFGYLIQSQTMLDIGVTASLIVPSDSLWKLAAYQLQPPPAAGIIETLRRAAGPFSVANPPTVWMGVYAALYVLVVVGGALAVFQRRDL